MMEEHVIDIIGLIAGTCTTTSFVPQVIKMLKTGHARDISMGMYVVLTVGIFLWLVYGILLRRPPIMIANGMSFTLCLVVIGMKIRYEKRDGR